MANLSKLSAPKPLLSGLSSRLGYMANAERTFDQHRDKSQHWRAWFKTARWRELRWEILTRDRFTCQKCRTIFVDTSQLVADHIQPHKGSEALFWNRKNLHCLCADCHNRVKQIEEAQGKIGASHPEWFGPSLVPLTIVCGPACSGKSTYVSERAAREDKIIDLDVIASEVSGLPLHRWDADRWLGVSLHLRNKDIAALGERPKCSAAWLIVAEPLAQWRAWWAKKLAPKQIVVIETPLDTCLARLAADPDRIHATTERRIRQWWSDYRPRDGDTRIKS